MGDALRVMVELLKKYKKSGGHAVSTFRVGFKSNPFSVESVRCRSFDDDLSSCMDIQAFHCGLAIQFSAINHVPFV